MFGFLSRSERMDFNPRGWTDVFPDSSGKPVDVSKQEDAEEFLNRMLDVVEKLLQKNKCPQVRPCFL